MVLQRASRFKAVRTSDRIEAVQTALKTVWLTVGRLENRRAGIKDVWPILKRAGFLIGLQHIYGYGGLD